MDFSFIRRWEALLTLAAIGALSATATVVVVQPSAVEVERGQACEDDLAAIRRHMDQMAAERAAEAADLERYLRVPPRSDRTGKGITLESMRRSREQSPN